MQAKVTLISSLTVLAAVALFSGTAFGNELSPKTRPSVGIDVHHRIDSEDRFKPRFGLSTDMPIRNLSGWGDESMGRLYPISIGINCTLTAYFREDSYVGVCGPVIQAGDLRLSAGAGLENGDGEAKWHILASIGYVHDEFSFSGNLEWGAAGEYHTVKAAYTVLPFSFGLMSQRYDGEGLYLGIGTESTQVYAAILYNIERIIDEPGLHGYDYLTGLIGISFSR